MNHYPRHVGDYIRDTVGLTMVEDGAYTRLLDQYYAREAPLPLDLAMVYRMARATSKVERAAVDSVLAMFFSRSPDGFRNKRADLELQAQCERSASARQSAKARWDKEQANAMRTHSDGNADSMLASSQKPVTIETKSTAMSSSAEKPPNLDVVSLPSGKPNSERRDTAKEILGFLNAKTSRNFRMVDANLGPIMARLKEGATPRELRAVVARKCREWAGDEKMVGFLRPKTLFTATNFAQYVGEVPPESEAGDAAPLP